MFTIRQGERLSHVVLGVSKFVLEFCRLLLSNPNALGYVKCAFKSSPEESRLMYFGNNRALNLGHITPFQLYFQSSGY
jgi:hypothetical protein